MTPRQRLIRLRDILRARPKADPNFDISVYVSERRCGTVACAIGWGAMDPVLNAEGLKLDEAGVPDINGSINVLKGLQEFFRLSNPHYLFFCSGWNTPNFIGPHDVADRIEEIMIHGEPTT